MNLIRTDRGGIHSELYIETWPDAGALTFRELRQSSFDTHKRLNYMSLHITEVKFRREDNSIMSRAS